MRIWSVLYEDLKPFTKLCYANSCCAGTCYAGTSCKYILSNLEVFRIYLTQLIIFKKISFHRKNYATEKSDCCKISIGYCKWRTKKLCNISFKKCIQHLFWYTTNKRVLFLMTFSVIDLCSMVSHWNRAVSSWPYSQL